MTTAPVGEHGVRRLVRRWPSTTVWLAAIVALQVATLVFDVVTHR